MSTKTQSRVVQYPKTFISVCREYPGIIPAGVFMAVIAYAPAGVVPSMFDLSPRASMIIGIILGASLMFAAMKVTFWWWENVEGHEIDWRA